MTCVADDDGAGVCAPIQSKVPPQSRDGPHSGGCRSSGSGGSRLTFFSAGFRAVHKWGATRTSTAPLAVISNLARRPLLDDGGVFRIASRSPEPARSTREEAADVHCGSGFWGGQRPSLAHYVTGSISGWSRW
jgi:hypothetical protein